MYWSFTTPFQEIENIRRQMNEVFQQYNAQSQFPSVNIYDSKEAIEVLVEAPGYSREELDIQLDNGVLSVKGTGSIQEPDDSNRVALRKERAEKSFEKKIQLTTDFEVDALSAVLNNGLLTVRLPKAARAQAKQIAIQ
jgi:HSP20 family protein